ncbi:uncharacterized protein LOC135947796 [Cloeon dipterum]|uniref:uncharacterized protein LOC135947796 n=1 Tax=Cloeon dipterum TaxID=197152 RepID=UPI0032204A15
MRFKRTAVVVLLLLGISRLLVAKEKVSAGKQANKTGLTSKNKGAAAGYASGVEIKREAYIGEYPYIVSVQTNNVHVAPGAIINKFFVFVEGYFIDILNPKTSTVVAGRVDLGVATGSVHHITRLTKHENISWPHNNVGLLRVCPPFSAKYREVPLPVNKYQWPTNTPANFLFYNEQGKLVTIDAATLADKECDALNLPNNWKAETEVCTMHREGNSCIFPFYPLLVARGRLAGAQTWGVCDESKTISLMSEQFVDVAMYTRWIRKNSAIQHNKCLL